MHPTQCNYFEKWANVSGRRKVLASYGPPGLEA